MKFITKNEKITDILLDKKEEILISDTYKLLAKIAGNSKDTVFYDDAVDARVHLGLLLDLFDYRYWD